MLDLYSVEDSDDSFIDSDDSTEDESEPVRKPREKKSTTNSSAKKAVDHVYLLSRLGEEKLEQLFVKQEPGF